METVSIGDAATRLGVSADTIRRRIGKGTLTARQKPTAQGFRWQVDIPEIIDGQEANGHHNNAMEHLLLSLESQVRAQAEELEARRREISELHIMLQQSQAALTAPKRRPWWRLWG